MKVTIRSKTLLIRKLLEESFKNRLIYVRLNEIIEQK